MGKISETCGLVPREHNPVAFCSFFECSKSIGVAWHIAYRRCLSPFASSARTKASPLSA